MEFLRERQKKPVEFVSKKVKKKVSQVTHSALCLLSRHSPPALPGALWLGLTQS